MVLKLDLDGTVHHVTILARRPHLVLSVDGRRHVVEGLDEAGDGSRRLTLDGAPVAFARASSADGAIIRLDGRSFALRLLRTIQTIGVPRAGLDLAERLGGLGAGLLFELAQAAVNKPSND